MKKCIEHGKELKGPNSAGKYWHLIDFAQKQYCSKTQAEYDAIPEPQAASPAQVREPIKERDYDEENRGKIRSLFIESRIIKQGLTPLSEEEKAALHDLVEIAMGVK